MKWYIAFISVLLITTPNIVAQSANYDLGVVTKQSKLLKSPKVLSKRYKVKLAIGDTVKILPDENVKYYKVTFAETAGWLSKKRVKVLPTKVTPPVIKKPKAKKEITVTKKEERTEEKSWFDSIDIRSLFFIILTIVFWVCIFLVIKKFLQKMWGKLKRNENYRKSEMGNNVKSNKLIIFLWIFGAHVVSLVLSFMFRSSEPYSREHRFYYFIFLILSGLVYLHRSGKTLEKPALVLQFITKNITNILIILVVGLIFQNFPDWDHFLPFLSHRSIFTHSVFVLFLFYLLLAKNPDFGAKNRLIINSIYMGMVIGISSHLFVDISYMFLLSPTIFLKAHTGHGWMPALPSALEVPYLLSMTLISLSHLNQILKIRFSANIISNVFRFQKLKKIEVYETGFLLYLAINMLFTTNLPSTILFGFWALVFTVISIILFILSKRESNSPY